MENKTTWKENRPIACLVLVLAVLKCDMPLKAFFCLRRIAGGNWIRNVTR